MSDKEGLGNKPIIVIIGLIASCIAIFAFVTGIQSLSDIFSPKISYNSPIPIPTSIPKQTIVSDQTNSSNIRATATFVSLPTETVISDPPKIYNKQIRSTDGTVQLYIPVEMGFGGVWIDQTEITGAQYMLCVNAGNCRGSAYNNGEEYPIGLTADWATDYCEWAGVRLPTRDEWLRAATGIDGRAYPWGDYWDDKRSNTSSSNGKGLLPVGSFPLGASPYGVLDMAGNAFEWVTDSTCEKGFRLQGTGRNASDPEDFLPSSSSCFNSSTLWHNTGARCATNGN